MIAARTLSRALLVSADRTLHTAHEKDKGTFHRVLCIGKIGGRTTEAIPVPKALGR